MHYAAPDLNSDANVPKHTQAEAFATSQYDAQQWSRPSEQF